MTSARKGFLEKEKNLLRVLFFQLLFVDKRKNKKNYTDYYQRTAGHNYDFHFTPYFFLLKYIPKKNTIIKAHQMIMLINLERSLKNQLANKAARIIFEKSRSVFAILSLCFSSRNSLIFDILTKSKKICQGGAL